MRQDRLYIITGFFVLGALLIIIAGSSFLYKQFLTSQIETFVMVFKGSLKGLEAGSPVTYRGVKIGEITRIEITENEAGTKVIIPVYVEFFVEKTLGFTKNPIQLLINNGYIANISKPSFLTGVADVELVKNDKPTFTFLTHTFHGYPVFPTQNKVEEYITVDEVLKTANKMFSDISALTHSKEILATFNAATLMATHVDKLSGDINEYLPNTLQNINQNLNKIGSAADSTKNLTDYLSRYPESLLRGKP